MKEKFGQDRPRIYIDDIPPSPDKEDKKEEEREKRGVEIIPIMPDDEEGDGSGGNVKVNP